MGVVPCLNEEKTIGSVVAATRQHVEVILVVDDGSADRTAEAAADAGAQVLRNVGTRGKGAALRLGWNWGLDHGFGWALSLDGDGQHSPEDIPKFFQRVDGTKAVLVVGNRMQDPGPMPRLRRFVNRWMSRRLSMAAGQWLPDSQCGFRLMNLKSWSQLRTSSTHFEIESEVLLSFALAGRTIEFVPVRALYKGEQSKIHPVRDTIRWFRWWRQVGKQSHRPCRHR